MPRIYVRKANALREKMTVPMSEAALARLKKHAEATGKTPTSVARELIEKNLPATK